MKDTRPVICYICRRKLYYAGHPKHEKEMRLYRGDKSFIGWIHAKCIRRLQKQEAYKKAMKSLNRLRSRN